MILCITTQYLRNKACIPFRRLPTTMPALKRKAESSSISQAKKPRPDYTDRSQYKESTQEIRHGIVLTKYYNPEITNERCHKYIEGELERPIDTLNRALEETVSKRKAIEVGDAVIYWFKMDLRMQDNHALHLASEAASKAGKTLICIYLLSPQDLEAHLTAPIRVDFMLRSLEILKINLAAINVPLYVETVEKRKKVPARLVELCKEWNSNHVFCNMEYEVDELRREAQLTRMCLENGISFNVVHDTCVVEPGKLKTGAGGQISVYSPWFRKWCAYLNEHAHELDEYPLPAKNPQDSRKKYSKLFECDVPAAPPNKSLPVKEKERFTNLWPAGEAEACDRLDKFLSSRVSKYHETRNLPAGNGTSTISVHLAAGTIAARTCIREARDKSPTKKLKDDRTQGHAMWISEVAWRDFYKHVLVHWPFVCMNKCFKPEYTNIEWEYNEEQFKAWTEGKTGFPIVDAAMRQCNSIGYMHNRCRMIVASFLAKDLMIDWRMGERYFMEHLIDGDFASNNGGWGFSASCGVDPQPYFRIFNPLLQSEKFDASGDYIRKWVPELKDIKGNKMIHDPYGRGAEQTAKKNGYPKPIVDHKMARERCLERYKKGIGRTTA